METCGDEWASSSSIHIFKCHKQHDKKHIRVTSCVLLNVRHTVKLVSDATAEPLHLQAWPASTQNTHRLYFGFFAMSKINLYPK